MNYVLWGHRGSDDHGSEDWIRGLCKLIKQKPDIASPDPEAEVRYGISRLGGVFQKPELAPGDRCITSSLTDVKALNKQGVETVLWGWSPERLTPGILRQLRRYAAVVVTERRSHRRLQGAGLKDNLHLGPEPAFLVEPSFSREPLPPGTIGLSLHYPQEASPNLFDGYCELLEWILDHTHSTVALIPYCVQHRHNDLLLNRALGQRFGKRVLLREDGSSPCLRGDLAQCRCCLGFAGAVAAWSCGVPALCLERSCRTLGLSRDLFGSCSEAVADWQKLDCGKDLIARFEAFLSREQWHRGQLDQQVFRMRHPWTEGAAHF